MHKLVVKHCGKFLGQDQISNHLRQWTPSKDSVCSNRRWKKIITHMLGWPGFQPLWVKRIEERGGTRPWRRRWQPCLKEVAPLEGNAFCVFQRSQLPTQTRQHKDCQRLKKNAKEKKNFFKSQWNGISLAISINKDFTAIYDSGPPNGNFSTRRAPKRKNNPCDIAADTTFLTDRSEGVGSWGCENAGLLAPDSWGACERNEFSESRRLHLPRHACVPAKSHQSCPTLCNSMDCSLPRVLCPWDSPGTNTGVGCHALFSHT